MSPPSEYFLYMVKSIFLLGFILFVSFLYVRRWIQKTRKYVMPPGPSGLPFVGTFREVSGLTLLHHKKKYGDISKIKILGKNFVFLHSAEAVREAFLNSNAFDSRPVTFFSSQIAICDMTFSSPRHSHWRKLRQIMHSSLKAYGTGMDQIENVITEEIHNFEDFIEKLESPVDIKDYLEASICNIMYILSIGKRFPYDDPLIQLPFEYLKRINSVILPLNDMILESFPWIQKLPFGLGQRAKDTIKYRRELENMLVDTCFLDNELQSQKGLVFDLLQQQKLFPETLGLENIKGAMENLFAGGINTTSAALYHFFLLMVYYPAIQLNICNEITSVIGDSRRPRVSDKHAMPYTSAAILELLRYASVLPLSINHTCLDDVRLRNFTVPKGTMVSINIFKINHDEEVFDNPWIFNPNRYLDESGNMLPATDPVRKNTLTFGIGSRACIGEVFAKTRIFLYVTHILQRFQIKASGSLASCDPRDMPISFITTPGRYEIIIDKLEKKKCIRIHKLKTSFSQSRTAV